MSGSWDATVKAVRAVDEGTDNIINVIQAGTAFDILAEIEVGNGILSFGGSRYRLTATVRNQSQFQIIYTGPLPEVQLAPPAGGQNLVEQVRVKVPAGWAAAEDDVLDVITSFSLKSGIYTDTTSATGQPFIVSA
jgi:hypothetical protein